MGCCAHGWAGLQSIDRMVDLQTVGGFLSKLMRAFTGEPSEFEVARHILLVAYRDCAKLKIELIDHPGSDPRVMSATILKVRHKDFVVSHPTIDNDKHPLVRGDLLRLSFLSSAGHLSGRCKALGRVRIARAGSGDHGDGGTSRGGGVVYGYRLSFPRSFEAESRSEERTSISKEMDVEAELYSTSLREPIRGVVKDISQGGLRIRSYNARGKLAKGQRVYLKVELPAPIGLLTEMVRVAHLAPGDDDDHIMIGVDFGRRIEAMSKFLEQNEQMQLVRRREG